MLDNKKIYLRTLSRSRSSLGINIPHKLAKLLEFNHNDVVRIETDDNEEFLIIRKVDVENL